MEITFEHAFAGRRGGAEPVRRLARTVVVGSLFGALAISGVVGALAATSETGFGHQPVYLAETDSGTMFSLPALSPGQTVTRYATVSSGGSAPSAVRLFATISGTGLQRFLTLTVTRGTGDADAFVPDADRGGAGPGVVFQGRLSRFPTTWEKGIDAGGSWATGEAHVYRFEVTLSDRSAAQGLSAGADFRWEAQGA
jgi:hypothetical protein